MTEAAGAWVQDSPAWLSQGDIFRKAPVVRTGLGGNRTVTSEVVEAPAMVATQNCTLDKRNNAGVMQVERIAFMPLRSLRDLPSEKATSLRRDVLQPYEAMYLGPLVELGESYVLLSNVYMLPASYFAPALWVSPEEPGGEPRLVVSQHDTRLGSLPEERISLLHDKWTALWTRRVTAPR